MIEQEKRAETAEERKARIRERYKGVSRNELEVIPAIQEAGLDDETAEKRVAVYVRVSTDSLNQTSSYELQKNHYEDVVKRHPGWNLINIYADEGISGTSLNHRDAFVQMIRDCHDGKIDLIITKSVSRFARNVLDCIGQVRQLAALPHPVGVLFETENLYTLNKNSEMALSFISTLAQEESHTKSDIMNASIEMRFSRGIFLTPALLGYDQDENGMLVINEDEAQTVRLCFFLYLYGYSAGKIAELMMKLGRTTKRGNEKWTAPSVMQILQNERHCGDVLARKTYTPNYLDHKSVKNRQNRKQYRQKQHHEAIISRDDFIAVQRLIANQKYGYHGCLPAIEVIRSGIFNHFIVINPKWGGFTKDDYLSAYGDSGAPEELFEKEETAEGRAGDFDLRGFQVVHGQFFDRSSAVYAAFSEKGVQFSRTCIEKLNNQPSAELLFDPHRALLAVRPADKRNRHAVQLGKITEKGYVSRLISGSAFIPIIFEIMGWDTKNKYRVRGIRKEKNGECFLLFELKETEILIPIRQISAEDAEKEVQTAAGEAAARRRKNITAYPAEWAESFGREYYAQERLNPLSFPDGEDWGIGRESTALEETDIEPTDRKTIKENIAEIIRRIQTGGAEEHESDGIPVTNAE